MSDYMRNWVFTINNPDGDAMSPTTWPDVKYCVWQKEKGEEGTEHWQGYVQLTKKVSFAHMKKLSPTAHWEVRKGSHNQAKKYAMKEDTRVDGPWEIGVDQGADTGQNGLTGVKRMIDECASMKDIAQEYPSEVIRNYRGIMYIRTLMGQLERDWHSTTYVLWGPSGSGKTSLVQRCAPGAYWMKKPAPGQGIYIDGYDGQEDFVIDEFYGWLPHDLLCRMCDRTPMLMDTKGGMVSFCPKRIWITSNKDPVLWYRAGLGALQRRLNPPLGSVMRLELERLHTEEELKGRVCPAILTLMEIYPSAVEGERVLQSLKGPKVCPDHIWSEEAIEMAKDIQLERELDKCEKVDDFFVASNDIVHNRQRVNYDDDDVETVIITRKMMMDHHTVCQQREDEKAYHQRYDSDQE